MTDSFLQTTDGVGEFIVVQTAEDEWQGSGLIVLDTRLVRVQLEWHQQTGSDLCLASGALRSSWPSF